MMLYNPCISMAFVDDSVDNVMIADKENNAGTIAIVISIVFSVLMLIAISAAIFCCFWKQISSGKINTFT